MEELVSLFRLWMKAGGTKDEWDQLLEKWGEGEGEEERRRSSLNDCAEREWVTRGQYLSIRPGSLWMPGDRRDIRWLLKQGEEWESHRETETHRTLLEQTGGRQVCFHKQLKQHREETTTDHAHTQTQRHTDDHIITVWLPYGNSALSHLTLISSTFHLRRESSAALLKGHRWPKLWSDYSRHTHTPTLENEHRVKNMLFLFKQIMFFREISYSPAKFWNNKQTPNPGWTKQTWQSAKFWWVTC